MPTGANTAEGRDELRGEPFSRGLGGHLVVKAVIPASYTATVRALEDQDGIVEGHEARPGKEAKGLRRLPGRYREEPSRYQALPVLTTPSEIPADL